jgi:hypothetical protein
MNRETFNRAVTKARWFLEVASTLDAKIRQDDLAFVGCKETGAVHRASMDLTRALADLRRSGYER